MKWTLLFLTLGGVAMVAGSQIRANLADQGLLNSRRYTRDEARQIVSYYNAHEFSGWFTSGGRSLEDVLGIFSIESNFDPDAIGDRHLRDMSWGIGQMRGSTAPDFGIDDPRALLDPATGIYATMRYLKWAWDALEQGFSRAPEYMEWIGSYNAGVGGVLSGNIPTTYVERWRTAAGR